MHRHHAITAALLLALLASAPGARGGDWPMYRHDARRSSITAEELSFPLRKAWVYSSAQPPRPAWPDPGKNLNRLDFDYAAHPVIAEGIVCFGSSADDTVRALELDTGELKWRFTTGGPVRFAPQIVNGKVYVGSDDGFLYCLDASNGNVLWTFDPSPHNEHMIGNGRMISRWPLRSGLLVDDGIIYLLAGMWPSEGIYAYALDAESGDVLWVNDTSGQELVIVGHVVSTVSGVNPQGAILASDSHLVVPTGRSAPATYDRHTGRLLKYHPGLLNGVGGAWMTLDGNRCYTYAKSFYSPLSVAALDLDTLTVPTEGGRFRVEPNSVFFRTWSYSLYEGKTSVLVEDGSAISRSAYGLAKAASHLVLGLDGSVRAMGVGKDDDGKIAWEAKVDGRAYELAIADGRLLVATDTGELTCFAPESTASEAAPRILDERRAEPSGEAVAPEHDLAGILHSLSDAGMTAGFALVAGDEDGSVSVTLADRTVLTVLSVVKGDDTAVRLRDRLLDTTALYGSRIHVLAVESGRRLPLPHLFANAVVVAGGHEEWLGPELCRVLRPYGGVLFAPGADAAKLAALCSGSDDQENEYRVSGGEDGSPLRLERGRLAGAWDGTATQSGDQRVRWPLRPAWFGEPGPQYAFSRKVRGQTLTAANGRFFLNGDRSLTAVDAYNGTIWWSRPLPFCPRGNGAVLNADDAAVYLTLEKGFFKGRGPGCIVLDDETGLQTAVYAPFEPGPAILLSDAQTWELLAEPKEGQPIAGTLALAPLEDGLRIELANDEPIAQRACDWALFLDFRPPATRYGLYEPGVYAVTVLPGTGADPIAHVRGPEDDALVATATATAADGRQRTSVELRWADVPLLDGRPPQSFAFGATLSVRSTGPFSTDIPPVPEARAHLFCDQYADGLNNGWATVRLKGDGGPVKAPAVIKGIPEPKSGEVADGVTVLPRAKWQPARQRLSTQHANTTRIHPLTGHEVELTMVRPFGCGSLNSSESCALMRGGTLSVYDFADDSGLRNFGGVRHSCGISSIAANGMWFASDGGAGCECTYNFLTSVALAPAERRLNEDWALFADWHADTIVRQAAINMGAPGDRRDADDVLWLGFPRHATEKASTIMPGTISWQQINGVWQQQIPTCMPVPIDVETEEGMGAYRVSADRVPIEGTDRPWLYSSGYRGIREAVVRLDPLPRLSARHQAATITADGILDEPAWDGPPAATLAFTKSEVRVAFDSDNLYVAGRRPAEVEKKGAERAWDKRAAPEVSTGYFFADTWECFLGTPDASNILHLAVSAGGAKLDALARDGRAEDIKWNGSWDVGVSASGDALTAEFAVPWATLNAVGIDTNRLAINAQTGRHPKVAEAIVRLGAAGRSRCTGLVPVGLGKEPAIPSRIYTVRLHFAELNTSLPAPRVFDVAIQGRTVLEDFEVAAAAGGPLRAVTREFRGIRADSALEITFTPRSPGGSNEVATIISAIEFFEEERGMVTR